MWLVLVTVSAVTTGAVGAWVSMVMEKAFDEALVRPEESVSVAVRLWLPSLSAGVVSVHWPLLFAVAVPSWVAPSNTFTVLLAAAVPVRVGVLSLVMWSPTVPLS